jgi:hypothetical protein
MAARAMEIRCRRTPIERDLKKSSHANTKGDSDNPPNRTAWRAHGQKPEQHYCRQRHQNSSIAESGQGDEPSPHSNNPIPLDCNRRGGANLH